MRKLLLIIFVALSLTVPLAGYAGVDADASDSISGQMDLSDWDFTGQGSVTLDGPWSFYWDALLPTATIGDHMPTGPAALPSIWSNSRSFDLPSFGRATYQLAVRTDGAARLYGLKLPEIYTEFAVWVNGQLLEANGRFADRAPVYLHPRPYFFYADQSDIEIVIQVQNLAHAYGGIARHIVLGTAEQIQRAARRDAAIDLVLITICLFAGFYHLVLYLFKRGNSEFVWFFLLCLSVALRNLFSNATLIMELVPELPFWLGSKIVTLSIPFIIVSTLFYTRTVFRHGKASRLFRFLVAVNGLYALVVVLAPSGFYSVIFPSYLASIGLVFAWIIYLAVAAIRAKQSQAGLLFAGMLFLSAGAIVDSLIYLQAIAYPYVLPITLAGFILQNVVLLARRYAQAYRRAEILSHDLQESLDKLTCTETAFMNAQMKPHFLFNALTAIAENCESDPKKVSQLILSLARYLRKTLDYGNIAELETLERELEHVRAYAAIEQSRFAGIEVVFDLPDPLPPVSLPPITLQPLVENAIRHGLRPRCEGGRVVVSLSCERDQVLFRVNDNGVGMPDDALNRLTLLPQGSGGIGLYNIHTRLTRLYGQGLTIQSERETGTSISFTVPLKGI
ncbi:MAG: histidine kinase [Clostridiales bacterium]|nr:histidine kinase [Clostridiales bacterium]